jgi:hypothetical protein
MFRHFPAQAGELPGGAGGQFRPVAFIEQDDIILSIDIIVL